MVTLTFDLEVKFLLEKITITDIHDLGLLMLQNITI